MGIMDKFKVFLGIPEYEYDDNGDDEAVSRREDDGAVRRDGRTSSANDDGRIHQLIYVKPTSFDDVGKIAEYLKNNITVVLNLEKVMEDDIAARRSNPAAVEVRGRIIDFLAGVVCALDGSGKPTSKSTFLFAPKNARAIDETDYGSNGEDFFN